MCLDCLLWIQHFNNMNKTKRAPNFRDDEKNHLFSIIADQFANILEDKKTDRASIQKRQETWKKIEKSYNSSSPSIYYRNSECLKKFYENSKKELRKLTAEHKQEIMKTGGGTPPDIKLDTSEKLLYGIMNSKTIHGLVGRSDCDGRNKIIKKCKLDDNINEVEYIYEVDNSVILEDVCQDDLGFENMSTPGNNLTCEKEIQCFESNQNKNQHEVLLDTTDKQETEKSSWSQYTPKDLRSPVNPALKIQNSARKGSANSPCSSINASRRRPVRTIQTLTSSKVAEKYDLLLDKRLCLVQKQIEQIDRDMSFKKHENKLKIDILELELKTKKSH